MTVLVSKPLTNQAYGYPKGHQRFHTPHILMVVHITGNPNNVGPTAAMNERNYANRTGSDGPSAHAYLDRDGGGVQAINHVRYAAWSNGGINKPNTKNAGVALMVKHHQAGRNPNECCWLEVESVGDDSVSLQITDQQLETLAQLVAGEAKRTGLPINRTTVLTHTDIDSVNRPHCAFLPATREKRMAELIVRANAILHPIVKQTVTIIGDKPLTISKVVGMVTVTGKNLTVK